MTNKINKIAISLFALSTLSSGVYCADWSYLSGTEPSLIVKDGKKVKNTNTSPRFWGFIQVGYQKNYGEKFTPTTGAKAGLNLTPFSMLPASLDSQSSFEVGRARLAARGMFDKGNTLNYFFMTEFGENGITKPAGRTNNNHITDASITYRGLQYANIRIGQFKYPGSEEGRRSVFSSTYRNFTTAGAQLLLERFLPNNAQEVSSGIFQAAPTSSNGAYRDRGVELFYTHKMNNDIALSYSGMIGNGTGLDSSNSSGSVTYYGYLGAEYLFHKGKGYYTQALKGFVWYQNGKRQLNNTNYTRERYGLGFNYFHNGLRLGAEWIKAKGMIYNGAKEVNADPNTVEWEYQIAADNSNVADGGYVNIQYFFIPKKFELMARYDYLNRLTNSAANEREFKTTTIGLSYHFKGPTRIDLNYAFKDASAPNNTKAQTVLNNIDNQLSIQATLKF